MRILATLTLCLALCLSLPAAALTIVSEASGNWAGTSNNGFYFRAMLVQDKDRLGLVIWNGNDKVPSIEGDPQFNNRQIALGAFATRTDLQVLETPNGSILQIVVEFADEEADGNSVLQLQYIDNQFTVVGYSHLSKFGGQGGKPSTYQCEVDLWNMTTTENGTTRQLEPVGFEALNASEWTFGAAFDRGFCTRTE